MLQGVLSVLLLQSQAAPIPPIDFENLPLQRELKQVADGWRSRYRLPGVWCALIREGKVVACVATGLKNMASDEPALVSDHLNVGSVSKPITGMIIAQFVARGVISYDTRVGDVFPQMSMRYPGSRFAKATLAQLIAHTSGLTKDIRFDTKDERDGISWRLKHVPIALASPLAKEPGTAYEYSNAGPVIATAMVERRLAGLDHWRALGSSYEAWLAGPPGQALGFTNPRMLDWSKEPSHSEVTTHYIDSGTPIVNREVSKDSLRYAPQGSCSISLTDMTRFCISVLDNRMELKADLLRILLHQPFEGSKQTLGAWGIGVRSGNLDHNGDTGRGEYAYVRMNPGKRAAIVFFTNGNTKDRVQSRLFREALTPEIARYADSR